MLLVQPHQHHTPLTILASSSLCPISSMGSSRPLALVPAFFDEDDDDDESTPFDIHSYFGFKPEIPICLDSLEDPPPGQKPAYTYAMLVKLAIWSSPQRQLTLSGIYEALEQRFSWFRECENPNAWKVSEVAFTCK